MPDATLLIDYSSLPSHLRAGMRHYIEDGIETGSFLRYVLEMDMEHAWAVADPESAAAMPAIKMFLQDEAPTACWGNKRRVWAWMQYKQRRLREPAVTEGVLG